MRKYIDRLFLGRMEEADLNKEASNAAAYYIKEVGSQMPLAEKSAALNYVAHGFFMGARWLESELGATKKGMIWTMKRTGKITLKNVRKISRVGWSKLSSKK